MLPFHALFRRRKDRSPSATPRSRALSELPLRSSINNDRARPEVPAINSTEAHGRKRKLSMVECDSDACRAPPSKARMRKSKSPKRQTTPSSTSSNASKDTTIRTRMSLDSENGRNGMTDFGKVVKLGLSECTRLSKKENREDRSHMKEDMDAREMQKKLRLLQKVQSSSQIRRTLIDRFFVLLGD